MRRMLGPLFAGALLVSACGGSGQPDKPLEQPGGDVDINWDQPVPGGVPIGDPAEASLAFSPDVPIGLGMAAQILATAPEHEPVPLHEIAWLYEDPAVGRFVVIERIADEAAWQTEITDLAAEIPGCETLSPSLQTEKDFGAGAGPAIECHLGKRSLLTIRDGVPAFMLETDAVTSVEWLEPLSGPRAKALEK